MPNGLEPVWGDGAPATRCTHQEAIGTRALLNAMLRKYPGSTSFGIESCRNARGGSSLSLHAEGRAADWHPATKAQGDEAFRLLVDNAWGIGAQEIIWWEQIWSLARQSEGVRPYEPGPGGSPHHDHIHIGQVPRAASEMTAAQAAQALEGGSGGGSWGFTPWGSDGPSVTVPENPLDALGQVAAFLTDPATYRRLGLVAAGALLVIVGALVLSRDVVAPQLSAVLPKGTLK